MSKFQPNSGETVVFQVRSNARIASPRTKTKTAGTLYITDQRVVHDFPGLFGMGAHRWSVLLEHITGIATSTATMTAHLEVSARDGSVAQFSMAPQRASEAAQAIEGASHE